jgi:hypothetical protein|tara:strand:+ start:414 stop:542 length:129 start_codon:yes stop_codon:yes gene_type:complete
MDNASDIKNIGALAEYQLKIELINAKQLSNQLGNQTIGCIYD